MTQLNSGIFLQGAHKKAKRPSIAKEGILGRIGGGKKAVSRTQIQVLDLVGEGEIEGLVSGDFHYFGKVSIIWTSGYQSSRKVYLISLNFKGTLNLIPNLITINQIYRNFNKTKQIK